MKRYEFEIEIVRDVHQRKQKLAERGSEGWRLVAVAKESRRHGNEWWELYFARESSEPAAGPVPMGEEDR